uniref:Uncharacterized protein n=1 Tax=Octopus bimaculoides TaxID=37653 RepID=A0A0L8GH33_OCTBM
MQAIQKALRASSCSRWCRSSRLRLQYTQGFSGDLAGWRKLWPNFLRFYLCTLFNERLPFPLPHHLLAYSGITSLRQNIYKGSQTGFWP